MTPQEILAKYNQMKKVARKNNRWTELDSFVEELAQMASGSPIILTDHPVEKIFHEARYRS